MTIWRRRSFSARHPRRSLLRDHAARLGVRRNGHAHKIGEAGQLAGGIAHDFNNVLTAIVGFADVMMAELPPGDARRADLQQILDAGRRGASLVEQLLALSHAWRANSPATPLPPACATPDAGRTREG